MPSISVEEIGKVDNVGYDDIEVIFGCQPR